MTLKLNGSTDGSVSIDAPADTSPTGTDITLTLPTTVGSADQFLKNSGTAGELEYSSMVETSTGIGISNSSPSHALHIHDGTGSSAQVAKIDSGGVGLLSIQSGTSSESRIEFGSSDNDDAGYIYYNNSDDEMKLGVNGSERASIDSSGNTVFKNSSYVSFNDNGYIRTDSSGFLRLQMGSNGTMFTNASNSEVARIETGGRLLLGISSVIDSNSTLEAYQASGQNHVRVQSNSLANGEYSMFRAHGIANTNTRQAFLGVYKHSGITNAAAFMFLEQEDGGNTNYWADNSGFFRSSSSSAHIGTTSGTIVGTQTSDLRLKNVGANVGYGLAEVKQLQPKQYALKKDPDVNKLGFIAQEVESIIPEAVFDTNEELDGHQEGDRTKLGMEYVQLIPVLVNAIKELSAEVDTLKTKVAALEAAE